MNNIWSLDVSKNFFQGTVVEAREINGGGKCMELVESLETSVRVFSFRVEGVEKFSTEFFFYIDTGRTILVLCPFQLFPLYLLHFPTKRLFLPLIKFRSQVSFNRFKREKKCNQNL